MRIYSHRSSWSMPLPRLLLLFLAVQLSKFHGTFAACLETDVEYTGAELTYGRLLNPATAEECQLWCQYIAKQKGTCKYFTFELGDENTAPVCLLKSGEYGKVEKKNRISGPVHCAGTCIEVGVDYSGSDLPDGLVNNVVSFVDCQRLCRDRRDCEFFSWASNGLNYRNCWLKSGSFIRTEDPYLTKISGPARCSGTCIEAGVDYRDSVKDASDTVVKDVASAEDCQKLCAQKSSCEFFTWASDNEDGCPDCRQNCWLKSGDYQRLPNRPNRVSGPGRCNAPKFN